jgi:hypothetical protein
MDKLKLLTPREVGEILGLRDYHAVLGRLRKLGSGPPFLRLGRKHSRVFYPADGLAKWIEKRSQTQETTV